MFKKKNIPNMLTILRIILVPLFVVLIYFPYEAIIDMLDTIGLDAIGNTFFKFLSDFSIYIALAIYLIASITDFLDGFISRRYGLITKFGKIMDPLADKLLVSTGFIILTGEGIIPAWITVIIVFRDFFVNALRMFGTDNNKELSASLSGKIKTVFQLIGVPLAILNLAIMPKYGYLAFVEYATKMNGFELFVNVFMSVAVSVATIATLASFVTYFIRFRKDIDLEK